MKTVLSILLASLVCLYVLGCSNEFKLSSNHSNVGRVLFDYTFVRFTFSSDESYRKYLTEEFFWLNFKREGSIENAAILVYEKIDKSSLITIKTSKESGNWSSTFIIYVETDDFNLDHYILPLIVKNQIVWFSWKAFGKRN